MGNSIYKSNCKFTISLDDDDPTGQSNPMVAGNPIRGKVIMEVGKAVPPAKIQLRFVGQERSIVVIRRETYMADYELCSDSAVLLQPDDTILPGKKVFPFAFFDLTSNHPASMEWGKRAQSCKIVYKLQLGVLPPNKKKIQVVAERILPVASVPLSKKKRPCLLGPESIPVTSLGSNKGTITIAAKVLNSKVGRGAKLKLSLACQNDSTASINRVEVALLEKVEWKTDDKHCLEESRTVAVLEDVKLPGILREKQDKQQTQQQDETMDHVLKKLKSKRNKVTLQVPADCRDSYHGTLIHVSHSLQITTFTKNSVTSNPSVQIDLQIGNPPKISARK